MEYRAVLKMLARIWAGHSHKSAVKFEDGSEEIEIDGRIHLAKITYIKASTGQIVTRVGELYKITDDKKGHTVHYLDYTKGKGERSCKVGNILSITILKDKVFPTKT